MQPNLSIGKMAQNLTETSVTMIIGKVVRILSDEEVVLNVGREDGVKENMEFVIFLESDHVYDPETGEDLGAIEIVKGRVGVYHVMDKMSRARTLTYQVYVPSLPATVKWLGSALYSETHVETRRRKLKVPESQVQPLAVDLVVRIGDKARSV
jgi:hypothetical protein